MRKLLLPISFLYSIVLFIRHKLYDWGIFRSKGYDIPSICVGNLNLGGTGKTPHVEYLLNLLSDKYEVAVLSRGYGRKTKGFLLAEKTHNSSDIGDEPLQYITKYDKIKVAVDENRCDGVNKLLEMKDPPKLILLDDAYQHRKIKPGLNILLTDYYNIYKKDILIPTGGLRDIKYAARRADIIVVTKSPNVLTPYYKKDTEDVLKALPYQKIFYSYVEYQSFKPLSKKAFSFDIKEAKTVLLFCGIANTYSLEDYLKRNFHYISVIQFTDHHIFTDKDIDDIINKFNHLIGKNKFIVTTEKDVMRLRSTSLLEKFEETPLFYIPIRIKFHKEENGSFDEEIINYINKYDIKNIKDAGE